MTMRAIHSTLFSHRTESARRLKKLRSILEVHGVEMIPAPTPNEPVTFEDVDNLLRDAISIRIASINRLRPSPIVGEFQVDIDGDSERMSTESLCAGNFSPIEAARSFGHVFMKSNR